MTGLVRGLLALTKDVASSRRKSPNSPAISAMAKVDCAMASALMVGGRGRKSQVEEDALAPRPGPVVAGAPEEGADDGQGRAEHEKHREKGDGQLAIAGLGAGVPIHVGDRHQPD